MSKSGFDLSVRRGTLDSAEPSSPALERLIAEVDAPNQPGSFDNKMSRGHGRSSRRRVVRKALVR
jgi:hypothetical protein